MKPTYSLHTILKASLTPSSQLPCFYGFYILQGIKGAALLSVALFLYTFLASPYPLLHCLNYYLSSDLWPNKLPFVVLFFTLCLSIFPPYYCIHVNDGNHSHHSHIHPKILRCITSLGAILSKDIPEFFAKAKYLGNPPFLIARYLQPVKRAENLFFNIPYHVPSILLFLISN